MIEYEEALRRILSNAKALSPRRILIEDAVGSAAAENVYSGIEMPPFDKSAMDGYALKAADTKAAPLKLKCIGLIQAGENFRKKLKWRECVKIMTGAALPENSDSVAMVEDTRQAGDGVEIFRAFEPGENVCRRGEDLRQGERVLERGKKISEADVAVLAAVGRRSVKVTRKPQAAILNTGGEIVPPGYRLAKNKIYNSNAAMLEALLKSDGIAPYSLGVARDTAAELRRAIRRGLGKDVLLVSGGVSMGDYDLVPEVLAGLGVRKIFHKVNVKPGKPFFFGVKNKTLIFGIPGNPVSNFLSYLIFVRPALSKMLGYACCRPEFKTGFLTRGFRAKPGRKHFVLVKITKKESRSLLTPVASHGSADILALSKADGFMAVDKESAVIKKKTKIKFITWKII